MGSCPSTCFTSKHDTHARRRADGTDAWSDCHDCEKYCPNYASILQGGLPVKHGPSSSLKVARGSEDCCVYRYYCTHPLATLHPCCL